MYIENGHHGEVGGIWKCTIFTYSKFKIFLMRRDQIDVLLTSYVDFLQNNHKKHNYSKQIHIKCLKEWLERDFILWTSGAFGQQYKENRFFFFFLPKVLNVPMTRITLHLPTDKWQVALTSG